MPTDMTRGPIFPMLTRFMLPLLIRSEERR